MFVWLSKHRELQEEIADLKFKLLVLTNQRDTALYNLDREREAYKNIWKSLEENGTDGFNDLIKEALRPL